MEKLARYISSSSGFPNQTHTATASLLMVSYRSSIISPWPVSSKDNFLAFFQWRPLPPHLSLSLCLSVSLSLSLSLSLSPLALLPFFNLLFASLIQSPAPFSSPFLPKKFLHCSTTSMSRGVPSSLLLTLLSIEPATSWTPLNLSL